MEKFGQLDTPAAGKVTRLHARKTREDMLRDHEGESKKGENYGRRR